MSDLPEKQSLQQGVVKGHVYHLHGTSVAAIGTGSSVSTIKETRTPWLSSCGTHAKSSAADACASHLMLEHRNNRYKGKDKQDERFTRIDTVVIKWQTKQMSGQVHDASAS